MKKCLTTAPILRHYDPDKSILKETDASKYVGAGILSPQDEKGTHIASGIQIKDNDASRMQL